MLDSFGMLETWGVALKWNLRTPSSEFFFWLDSFEVILSKDLKALPSIIAIKKTLWFKFLLAKSIPFKEFCAVL